MEHLEHLSNDEKERYKVKISMINCVDPYTFPSKDLSSDFNTAPDVAWGDVQNYFVHSHSAYTMEQFGAFKSLEAYRYFKCGWVKSMGWTRINDRSLLVGKVMHSLRLNEKPLHAWVITEFSGKVLCAHCTCVAGLSECCSHVGAILFFIHEVGLRKTNPTVTDVPAYWVGPSTSKHVPFSQVEDMDFSLPFGKKRKGAPVSKVPVSELSEEEVKKFLTKLQEIQPSTALLNIVQPFCCPAEDEDQKYPVELSTIYNESLRSESLPHLRKIVLNFKYEVSQAEANHLMGDTTKQASSTLWHRHRKGRITASNFKAACRTSLEKPSMSLIKKICYPSSVRLTTRAVKWGCIHEKDAREEYVAKAKKEHHNFKFNPSGLMINPDYPHFGASPDGLVECECCGEGCIEIKCPFCLKDCDAEGLEEQKSCLDVTATTTTLKRDHLYYYQVQAQIFISERFYCDFILWTKKTLFIERIERDQDHWNRCVPLATSFFRMVILPELLAKHYTNKEPDTQNVATRQTGPLLIRLSKASSEF